MKYVVDIPYEGAAWNSEMSQMFSFKEKSINSFSHMSCTEGKHRWTVNCDPLVMMIFLFQMNAQVVNESEESR